MKRSKHSLSHYRLLSADMGVLTPIACFEVLPGDTVQQSTSLLVRVTPLLAPVMHPVSVRVHHWFVPYRLVWSSFENFITGGSDGAGDGAVYPAKTITPTVGSLADYLGLPTGTAISASALPFRAYQKIWNEFYRDEDLTTAAAVSVGNGPGDVVTSEALQSIAWEKDYFTSARPWAQKGAAVTLPLGTTAPVITGGTGVPSFNVPGGAGARTLQANAVNVNLSHSGAAGAGGDVTWNTTSLLADLASATAVDVNTVRRAFALQRYQEARAQYGSRYVEYLRYLGVRSSDARLQRPEYLGGGKQTISFSEVLQTGTNFDANAGVGSLKGHGISAVRSRRYRRFFEEHGVVLSLLSVRPRTMYQDGVPRFWLRTTKEDFYQKELEHIGQQIITNREIRSAHASPAGTFGYQNRYSEYHHVQSGVSGDFRSTLNFWHMGRIFGSDPALNSAFVTCDPATRVYASTSTDPLWIMASHSIQARRPVSRSGIGRIV